MFKNRFLLALGVISLLLVTMAVSRPYSNAAKSVNLSQPARPMIIPLSRISNLPDYFQRHPELRVSAGAGMVVDVAGDFYLRHTDWAANVGIPVTGSSEAEDYFMRHPALISSSVPADLSDYFLRH